MSDSIDLSGRDAELVFRAREARAQAGRARAQAERIERELVARLGDANVGIISGIPAVRVETEVRPGIDLVRLREDHPELWEQYQTERRRTQVKFPQWRPAS